MCGASLWNDEKNHLSIAIALEIYAMLPPKPGDAHK